MENLDATTLLVGAILLCLFSVWLYALVSALKNERLDSTMKLVWVLVIVLVNGLGVIIYLLVAPSRPRRDERVIAEWEERKRRRS
jgi:uncharacterized protein YacL